MDEDDLRFSDLNDTEKEILKSLIKRFKETIHLKLSAWDVFFTELTHDQLMKIIEWQISNRRKSGALMFDILNKCHYYYNSSTTPNTMKEIYTSLKDSGFPNDFNPFFLSGGHHINDDFFVYIMFKSLKSRLKQLYETEPGTETPIIMPCRIGNTFFYTGNNQANVRWISETSHLYAHLEYKLWQYSHDKGNPNRVNFVCDAERSIISNALNDPILPDHFDIHLLFSNSTYADPGPCMSFKSDVAKNVLADTRERHDNKKYVHYYKEYKHVKDYKNKPDLQGNNNPPDIQHIDYSLRENLSMFRWEILRELDTDADNDCKIKQRTNMGSSGRLFDFHPMEDAKIESSIKEIKSLIDRMGGTNLSSQEKAKICQLKRLGDHLQLEFVLWLVNDNGGIQPNTNDPDLAHAKNLENIESYESPYTIGDTPLDPERTDERSIPFVRHKNTYFVTHDWPAFCFAAFNGINCIYRSDHPKGWFICSFNFLDNVSIPPQPPAQPPAPTSREVKIGGFKFKKQKKNKTKKRKTFKKKRIFKS
jgi:hypothetical protein